MSSGFYTDGKARDAVRLLSSQLASDLKEPLSQAMAERAAKLMGESRALNETVQDAKRFVSEATTATQKSVAAADQAQSAAQRTEAAATSFANQVIQGGTDRGADLIVRAHEKADKALATARSELDRSVKAAIQAGDAAGAATQAAEDARIAALGASEAATNAAKAANDALNRADQATQAAEHATAEVRETSKELREANRAMTLASQSLAEAKTSTAALTASAEQAARVLKDAGTPLGELSAQVASMVSELAAARQAASVNRWLSVMVLLLVLALCGMVAALFVMKMK